MKRAAAPLRRDEEEGPEEEDPGFSDDDLVHSPTLDDDSTSLATLRMDPRCWKRAEGRSRSPRRSRSPTGAKQRKNQEPDKAKKTTKTQTRTRASSDSQQGSRSVASCSGEPRARRGRSLTRGSSRLQMPPPSKVPRRSQSQPLPDSSAVECVVCKMTPEDRDV